MRAYDIILKKRNGITLTPEDIYFFIRGFDSGSIPDYQMAALSMAVYYMGLNQQETNTWVEALLESGEVIDMSSAGSCVVDKHSTGGVGDTTTLVLLPLVSSAGIAFAKISGRGLGHTGGSVDKFASIPGFQTALEIDKFIRSVRKIGAAFTGQTDRLVPADKKLYALRDATATVDSVPLIASSVMSKKIAAGADAIVLDVKAGSGAFMKSEEEARDLARVMLGIGEKFGKRMVALITQMEQPLGNAVGNSLEVREALETLKGRGPQDLRELCLALGSYMLVLGGICEDPLTARKKLEKSLDGGAALEKFREIIINQGGREEVIENYKLLPRASIIKTVFSHKNGYIRKINAEKIGRAVVHLGSAGCVTKNGGFDPSAGIVLNKKTADRVKKGEVLAEVHGNCQEEVEKAVNKVYEAYDIGSTYPANLPLIYDVITDRV